MMPNRCPFCQSLPKIVHEQPMEKKLFNGKTSLTEEMFYVKCRGNDHKMIAKGKTKEDAISVWNGVATNE